MRVYKHKLVSIGHAQMTLKQNKLVLLLFDFKRFFLFEGISSVLFGHKAAEKKTRFKKTFTCIPTHSMTLTAVRVYKLVDTNQILVQIKIMKIICSLLKTHFNTRLEIIDEKKSHELISTWN